MLALRELDPARIGEVLLRLPVAAAQLGHAAPRNTLPYLEGSDAPEVRFVIDVLGGMSTEKVADKWYGGMTEMPRLMRELRAPKPERRDR